MRYRNLHHRMYLQKRPANLRQIKLHLRIHDPPRQQTINRLRIHNPATLPLPPNITYRHYRVRFLLIETISDKVFGDGRVTGASVCPAVEDLGLLEVLHFEGFSEVEGGDGDDICYFWEGF